MKNLIKVVLLFAFVTIMQAEVVSLNDEVKGIKVLLQSEKSVVVGDNNFFVTLSKYGKNISDARVKVKFFMPEMPGMPYMEYIKEAKKVDGKYKVLVNFAMGGTWQYQLKFMTKDGKKYKLRGSINL